MAKTTTTDLYRDSERIPYAGRFSPFRAAHHYYDDLGKSSIHFVFPLILFEGGKGVSGRGYAVRAWVKAYRQGRDRGVIEVLIPRSSDGKVVKDYIIWDQMPESEVHVIAIDPEVLVSRASEIPEMEGYSKAYIVGDNVSCISKSQYTYIYIVPDSKDSEETRGTLQALIVRAKRPPSTFIFACLGEECVLDNLKSEDKETLPSKLKLEFKYVRGDSPDKCDSEPFIVNVEYRKDKDEDKDGDFYLGYMSWIEDYSKRKYYFKAYPVNMPIYWVSLDREGKYEAGGSFKVMVGRGFVNEVSISSVITTRGWGIGGEAVYDNIFAPSSMLLNIMHSRRNSSASSVVVLDEFSGFPSVMKDNLNFVIIELDLTKLAKDLAEFYKVVVNRAFSGKGSTPRLQLDPRVTLKVFTFGPMFWLFKDSTIGSSKRTREKSSAAVWVRRVVRLTGVAAEKIGKAIGENFDVISLAIIAKYNNNILSDVVYRAISKLEEGNIDGVQLHSNVIRAIVERALSGREPRRSLDRRTVSKVSSAASEVALLFGVHGLSHVVAEYFVTEYSGSFVGELVLIDADRTLLAKIDRNLGGRGARKPLALIEGALGLGSLSNEGVKAKIILAFEGSDVRELGEDVKARSFLADACRYLNEKTKIPHETRYPKYYESFVSRRIEKLSDADVDRERFKNTLEELTNKIVREVVREARGRDVLAPTLLGARSWLFNRLIKEFSGGSREESLRVRRYVGSIIDGWVKVALPQCFDSCNVCVGNSRFCSLTSKWAIDSLSSLSVAQEICRYVGGEA